MLATHPELANKRRRRKKKQRNKRAISHFIHTGAHTFFCSQPIPFFTPKTSHHFVRLLLCFIIIIISALVLNAKVKSWNVLTDYVAVFARTDFRPLICSSLLYLLSFSFDLPDAVFSLTRSYCIYNIPSTENMNVLLFCVSVCMFFLLSKIINNHEMWP
jgi:hypothetical protein